MMIGNRKEEGRVCTVPLHIIRKSPMPSKNRLTAVLNKKSLSPSLDSNPACSDRMPLLYRVNHHHCQLIIDKKLWSQTYLKLLLPLQQSSDLFIWMKKICSSSWKKDFVPKKFRQRRNFCRQKFSEVWFEKKLIRLKKSLKT